MNRGARISGKIFFVLTQASVALSFIMLALPALGEVRIQVRRGTEIETRAPSIRVDVELVMVPVTVTDRRGRIVTGLSEQHFRVFDDKAPQPIVSFSGVDAPASIGLVFDTSGSMRDKIDKARVATRAFFDTLNPRDEAFLLTFSDRPKLRRAFSSDFPTMQSSLLPEKPRGATAYLDAIVLALHELRSARHGRRALIVVSDGEDNRSRFSRGELKALAVEADAQIHSIGIHDRLSSHDFADRMETSRAIDIMDELSELTGGIHLKISDFDDLRDAMEKIAIALHHQYLIGYRPPPDSLDGKWRRIRVKLSPENGQPKLRVYARRGYYTRDR